MQMVPFLFHFGFKSNLAKKECLKEKQKQSKRANVSNVPIIFCATIIFSALRESNKILLHTFLYKRSITANINHSVPPGN